MLGNFIKSEVKKWSRDAMMGFMIVYPIIFALLGRYLLPWIENKYAFDFTPFTDLILVILVLFLPITFGALIGFSILEDRDDNVLINIQVTPLSLHQFLGIRLVAIYLLCILSTIGVTWFVNMGDISMGNIVAISLLASLEAPISGLLINALAKNKIEGFAIMKAGGSIIMFPIIALFLNDVKELFFAFAPGFWTAKSISSIVRGGGLYLSHKEYYFIGIIYMIILNILSYTWFIQKTNKSHF